MPRVLTRNATILCPHGGVGQTTVFQPDITILGAPILRSGDTGIIAGCANLPPAGVPCTAYVLRSMGLNSVTVGGIPAMLDTDFTQSNTGYPLTLIESHPVEDNTLPVPVPPGGSVPTPPELRDIDRPGVVAAPPALAFSKAGFTNTGQPAALSAAFTLTSRFPNRWMLMLIVPPTSTEITDGGPIGVTVSPTGGAWTSSPLVVSVVLTGAYMMTLPVLPAKVTLVAVGINRRGRSAHAEALLAVSP